MKRQMNYSQLIKGLLVASLLMLGFKTMAQHTTGETREIWTPTDVRIDGNGNPYAYYNEPQNWSDDVLPTEIDTNNDAYESNYISACYSDGASAIIPCLVTNDQDAGHIYDGFGGAGDIIVTNACNLPGGVQLKAGFHDGGDWTGLGYVAGPGYMNIEPGCDFSCGNHLWIGQGNYPDQGFLVINGGTLHVPNGQFGLGWNGTGGTNYCWVTNGATLYLTTWQPQTLGGPGIDSTKGILDIGVGSSVIASNNVLTEANGTGANDVNFWETNGQLTGYEGTGSVNATYNPANNTTTFISVPAFSPTQTPVFSIQPSNVVTSIGDTASFTAVVSNVGVNYQWQFNGANVSNGNGVSGATTSTLTIANITAAETGVYICTATNSTAAQYSASSSPATLAGQSFNLYPVISINGINGDTYEVQYTTSLTPPVTWTTLQTVTVGAGTDYVVDTSTPLAMTRFYRVIQEP